MRPRPRRRASLAIGTILFLCAGAHAADCTDNIPGKLNNRFSDNGNGTATDTVTRLIWQRCVLSTTLNTTGQCSGINFSGPVSYTWQEALQEADKFNQAEAVAGRPNTWRVPNIKELATIVDMHCMYDTFWAIDTKVFPGENTTYWSSTPVVQVDAQYDNTKRQNGAWTIDFLSGREAQTAVGMTNVVRLVR